MFMPKQYRAKAAEYTELLKTADSPGDVREFQNLERSFTTLADNEQWLADNYDRTVHASEHDRSVQASPAGKRADVERPDVERPDLAEEEEHVLRCLGAALIMQWNTLPRKLQRELFDNAGAVGELLDTPALRGKIARFLHKHKDDENEIAKQPFPASDVSQHAEDLARWKDEGGASPSPASGY